MPKIRGITEVRPVTMWHAYIDDYRCDRLSPSSYSLSLCNIFFTNWEDERRTNFDSYPSAISSDTLLIQEVGLRFMFSDMALYMLAFTCCRFELIIGETLSWKWNAGMHVGVDPYSLPKDDPLVSEEMGIVLDGCDFRHRGFCSFLPLSLVLSVPPRQNVRVIMNNDAAFADAMQRHHDAKVPGSYAEVCIYLSCLQRREVL